MLLSLVVWHLLDHPRVASERDSLIFLDTFRTSQASGALYSLNVLLIQKIVSVFLFKCVVLNWCGVTSGTSQSTEAHRL